MNAGKTVFAQLMNFLPVYEFHQCVERYDGEYKVKSFSCWDQYLSMAFAQLTYRESLRDIEACLRAAGAKLYHMGIRGKVSRNTLANANQVRDWRIYRGFCPGPHRQGAGALRPRLLRHRSEPYYLCARFHHDRPLPVAFPLGGVQKTKGAVKLHTLLDLRGSIPAVL